MRGQGGGSSTLNGGLAALSILEAWLWPSPTTRRMPNSERSSEKQHLGLQRVLSIDPPVSHHPLEWKLKYVTGNREKSRKLLQTLWCCQENNQLLVSV